MIVTAFFRMSLLFENKAYQQEVDRNGNAEHGNRCQCLRNPHVEEQVEQGYMQQIVAQVCAAEPHRLSPRGLSAEGEVGTKLTR